MKQIILIIERIQLLTRKMLEAALFDKAIIYSALVTLCTELELINLEFNDEDGYVYEKIGEIRSCSRFLAGLDETAKSAPDRHLNDILNAIDSLRSDLGFGRLIKE